MSADKYPSMFSCQMEAIVYIISKYLHAHVDHVICNVGSMCLSHFAGSV